MVTIWTPDLSRYQGARYKALAEAISNDILSGVLSPDEKLPPQRRLADVLGVTVGTVTRGYAEAERRGLVNAKVGSGTYIRSSGAQSMGDYLITDKPRGFTDLTVSLPVDVGQHSLLANTLQELHQQPELLSRLLGYHPEGGFSHHREIAAQWLSYDDFTPSADCLTLCNGGQQAIQLALMSVCQPGDTLLAEGVAYPGLKVLARQLKLKIIPLSFDHEGMLTESIDGLCRQYSPRLIYCTPTQHNPTNTRLSKARRESLVQAAQRNQLLIIEDEVSAVLAEQRDLPLAAMLPDQVFYISSCSKSMAGGLRVGFLVSPPAYHCKVSAALRASCWMAAPLMVEIACRWIKQGYADKLLNQQKKKLRERFLIVKTLLAGLEFHARADSFFVWLPLPDHWRALDFVRAVEKQKIMITAAESFAVANYAAPQAVRICISAAENNEVLSKALLSIKALALSTPDTELSLF